MTLTYAAKSASKSVLLTLWRTLKMKWDALTQPYVANMPVYTAEHVPLRSSRVPHSNAARRAAEGIPHGVSGAKLARKALAGKVGK